jgi:protein kinase D
VAKWLIGLICLSLNILSNCFSHFFTIGLLQLPSGNVVPKQSRSPSLGGRTVDKEVAGRIRIPHTFVLHSYMRPTVCHFCRKLLKGIIKQGMQCKDCHCNAHKKCVDKMPKDCIGESLSHVLASSC